MFWCACAQPNAYAKVVNIDTNNSKIILFAKRAIEVGEEVVKEPAKETSDLSMRAALKYWPYRLQIHFSTDANDTRDGT